MALINLTSLGIFAEPWILYTTEYRLSMAEPTRLRIFTERTVEKLAEPTRLRISTERTNERGKLPNQRASKYLWFIERTKKLAESKASDYLSNARGNLPNNEPQYMYRTVERKWKLAETTSLEVLNLPNERRLLQCYQVFLLLFVEPLHRYQPA